MPSGVNIRPISAKEREIIQFASQGLGDKEIASELKISVRTVGTYWERIRVKTGKNTRTACVVSVLNEEAKEVAREALITQENLDDVLREAQGLVLFSIDLQGKILDWNPGVFRMLGFSRKDFVGCNFCIIFTPADTKTGVPLSQLENASIKGHPLEGHYHIRSDDTEIWIEGVLVAHFEEGSKVRGFSILLKDETMRKSQEVELEKLRREILEQSNFEGFTVHTEPPAK